MYAALGSLRLATEPGKSVAYSNLGMGLLGHLLALKMGKPYESLVKDLLCMPLGMLDTTITLSEEQKRRLLAGHHPKGQPVPGWDFDVLAAAGALRSTVADLLTFLAAHFPREETPLGQALALAMATHFTGWLGDDAGLGWSRIEDVCANRLRVHWHNGGTGGFMSFLGCLAEQGIGVVLLSNHGDAWAGDDSLDRLGFRLLRTATKVSLA